MNEAHFLFFLLYVADLHNLKICHKHYKNYGTLMNHLKKVHGKTLVLKCDKCETEFSDGKAFGLHKARKTDCSIYKRK